MWLTPADTEGESGIVAVHLMTPSGGVRVDYTCFKGLNNEFWRFRLSC